jgi:hypothetical protein
MTGLEALPSTLSSLGASDLGGKTVVDIRGHA